MHRALQIPEILQLIFRHLQPEHLANLLRTSGFFFFPAASQLWETVDTDAFMSLVNLFLDKSDLRKPGKRSFSIATRWRRFQMYAPLIQTLQLDLSEPEDSGSDDSSSCASSSHTHSLISSSLSRLSALTPRTFPLLSALRTLQYTALTPSHLQHILIFLTPSMEHLHVRCFLHPLDYAQSAETDWALPVGALLDALPRQTPRLRTLQLATHMPHDSIHLQTVMSALTRLPALQNLATDFVALHPSLVGVLARHPALASLRIGFYSGDAVTDSALPDRLSYRVVCHPSFPALRSLHLHSTATLAPTFLKTIPPQLTALTLDISADPLTDESVAHLAASLHSGQPHLRTLQLSLEDWAFRPSTSPSQPPALPFDLVAPLLACRHISAFAFAYRSPSPFDLQDRHVVSMAQAWPGLENLSLAWLPASPVPSPPTSPYATDPPPPTGGGLADESALTLSALCALATHCKRIRHVALTQMTIRSVPPPPPTAQSPPSGPGGRHPPPRTVTLLLSAPSRILVRPELLAAFLFVLWPGIQLPQTPGNAPSPTAPTIPSTSSTMTTAARAGERWCVGWGEVRGMISGMRVQQVMQERKGAGVEGLREGLGEEYWAGLMEPAGI